MGGEVLVGAQLRLSLLNGFDLSVDGRSVELSEGAQRLVAALALNDKPLQRSYLAGILWEGASEQRAQANLRSTLWRLRVRCGEIVEPAGRRLQLSPDVVVDLHRVTRSLRQLVEGQLESAAGLPELPLIADVLPDWYDDWLETARHRYRQFKLQALETIAEKRLAVGRHAEAV